jgi:hypothetical protein
MATHRTSTLVKPMSNPIPAVILLNIRAAIDGVCPHCRAPYTLLPTSWAHEDASTAKMFMNLRCGACHGLMHLMISHDMGGIVMGFVKA